MNSANNQTPSGGLSITPGDVIYTLFRHKTKIVLFFILGLVAGGATWVLMPLPYVSNAKLLVRYVSEGTEQLTTSDGSILRPDSRGNTVMDAEVEILSSSDIALSVAEKIGPEKILSSTDGLNASQALYAAANQVATNTKVMLGGRDSKVIQLSFSHNDSDVARKVLQTTIEDYLVMHLKVHSTSESFNNALLQQADQLKTRLAQTEEELQRARKKAGVINLTDAKITLTQEIGRIRQSIFETDAELAEYTSARDAFASMNAQTQVNPAASPEEPEVDPEYFNALTKAIETYENLRSSLQIMQSREQALLLQFTAENSRVKSVQSQIKDTKGRIDALIEKYPNITSTAITSNPSTKMGLNLEMEVRAQSIRIRALQSRANVLKSQLAELRGEADRIDLVEVEINELDRRRELEATNYKNLVVTLESERLKDDLRAGRTNNISVIQAPSIAEVEKKKKIQFAGGIAGGLGIIGLAWAFLVDLLLDRTIKRPTEIQRNLGIPLFMNLPDLNDKRFRKTNAKASRQHLIQAGKLKQQQAAKKLPGYNPKSPTLQAAAMSRPEQYGTNAASNTKSIAPWDDEHALNEHFEALRDKVITYFESKNLTHKPKLIAMTGLGEKSGVTTIASGLAGSLSKIGEGNVLLVDMTLGHETAQQFYQGKNILNLDEVLESNENAKVENHLYVVAEGTNGMKLPRIMPQRFNKIMPRLRASDFDYIIFDMPPVSPISSTPRLASFMDVVLMVMESEETNRDVANQAIELLAESKAHLGGILNKTKFRVPRKLEQDLLSQS